jgi:hypothetical protein
LEKVVSIGKAAGKNGVVQVAEEMLKAKSF